MWSLLDADQEIPWPDQPLVLHHKWRFWVQPYNASYHTRVGYGFNTALLIGSPWEFDVPKCADGVEGCELVNGSWIHTISGSTTGHHSFVALNFHCHAPTCLSMSVYACEIGTPLEDCNATVGKLLCEQWPVYGGTGAPQLNGTRFDEPGYIAIPDCAWGDAQFGLEAPPNLEGVPLHMVKRSNATWGHYGELQRVVCLCFIVCVCAYVCCEWCVYHSIAPVHPCACFRQLLHCIVLHVPYVRGHGSVRAAWYYHVMSLVYSVHGVPCALRTCGIQHF
jgi:hypothetical protein